MQRALIAHVRSPTRVCVRPVRGGAEDAGRGRRKKEGATDAAKKKGDELRKKFQFDAFAFVCRWNRGSNRFCCAQLWDEKVDLGV